MSDLSATKPPAPPPPPPLNTGRTRSSARNSQFTTAATLITNNDALESSPRIEEEPQIGYIPTRASTTATKDPTIMINHNKMTISTQTDDTYSMQPRICVGAEEQLTNSILNIRSLQGCMHRIIISKNMDVVELAYCIAQVTFDSYVQSFPSDESTKAIPDKYVYPNHNCSVPNVRKNDEKIAGLFRERDNVFIPLQLIMEDFSLVQNESFRLSSKMSSVVGPSQKKELPDRIYYGSFVRERLIYATLVLYATWKFSMSGIDIGVMMEPLMNAPFAAMEIIVDYPLRELYR